MLNRPLVMVSAAAVFVLVGAVPALGDSGWGTVDCSQNPHPGCELGSRQGRRQETSSPANASQDASAAR